MTDHTLITELTELLETDASGASYLLKEFTGSMSRELLLHGRFGVKGLGLFTVAYTAPQKKRGEEGWFYAPPVQSIVWRARCGKDDTLHLVLNGMHLEAGEAERVSWALGRVFSRAGKKRLDLHLAGFGVFGSVGKGYGFTADEGIISILNSDYEGLKGMPSSSAGPSAIPKIVAASVFVLAFLAMVAFFFFPVGSSVPALKPELPALSRSVLVDSMDRAVPAPAPPAAVDPVLLDAGEFTVILATYTSEMKARLEVRRLDSVGIQTALWPAYSNGVKYWRIRIGRFVDRSGARAAIRALGDNAVSVPYIQEVTRQVLTNGKKSM